MNSRRIVLGGLAAGAAISIGGMIFTSVIASNGLVDPTPPGVILVRAIGLGLGCVLMYALMIPRLGPGTRTAATAGLIAFLIGSVFPPFALALNGALDAKLLLYSIIWNAVQIPLATVLGSTLYREVSNYNYGNLYHR